METGVERFAAEAAPVVVVGGGLAGLTAAALLARAGVAVVVCERAASPGGRAATHAVGDYRLNLGPHALYCGGAAAKTLGALGLPLTGGLPPGGWALRRGRLHTFPGGALSLLTTGLLPFAAKRRAISLLSWLGRLGAEEAAQLASQSVAGWIAERAPEPALAELMAALFRIATYTADLERLSAGAALAQLASASQHGVRYLDGGWQTLVDGVAAAALVAGAIVWARAAVSAVSVVSDLSPATASASRAGVPRLRVRLADGRALEASAVILAAGPHAAASLLPDSPQLAAAAAAVTPVRAACLDLALSSLPRPRAQFALGIDRPVYFSLHSAGARLAPAGGAVLHVARYLDGSADDDSAEAELEALCDRLQPGWRARLVERRFLPRMIVTQDMPRAAAGGLAGRAPIAVADVPGVYVAGDWVGPEGMLADAAVASATAATRAILAARRVRQPGTREAA
jgi:phytoene dehydrogenase-like protein